MDFTEFVVLLILAPPVLAKLARLMEAKRQARNEHHHSDNQEPTVDVPKNLPSKRHGHKGRRARRRRHR